MRAFFAAAVMATIIGVLVTAAGEATTTPLPSASPACA
jgi:hypothetical protein